MESERGVIGSQETIMHAIRGGKTETSPVSCNPANSDPISPRGTSLRNATAVLSGTLKYPI